MSEFDETEIKDICASIALENDSKNIYLKSNPHNNIGINFSKEENNQKNISSSIINQNGLINIHNSYLSNNNNVLNSYKTTKTIHLLDIFTSFFKKIKAIILPENLKNYDFDKDDVDEKEIDSTINEIVSKIKYFKDRIDDLDKNKILENTKTDINCICKEIKEIKDISIEQNKHIIKIEKINDDLMTKLIEAKKEINNLNIKIYSLNEYIKENNINIPKKETKKINNDNYFQTMINYNTCNNDKNIKNQNTFLNKKYLITRKKIKLPLVDFTGTKRNNSFQNKDYFSSPSTSIKKIRNVYLKKNKNRFLNFSNQKSNND